MIDFYFDFLSPYGYMGAVKVEALAAKYGRRIDWHPMLLGVSVMKVMGLKPLLETPLKGEYVLKDVQRLASLYDIPLVIPKNGLPKPVPPARAFCWFKNKAPVRAAEAAMAIYNAQWRDGLDISQPELLAELAQSMGFDGQELLEALEGDELRLQLQAEVNASLALGVFGSPTFIVDEEMIWGSDRMWMLEHWLQHGRWGAGTESLHQSVENNSFIS